MKKIMFFAALVIAVACNQKKSDTNNSTEPQTLDKSKFETVVDGKQTCLYTIKSDNIVMQVTNYGGRVTSLYTKDRNGEWADIVLGYDNIDKYINNTGERFLGAPVGRVANRIGKGHFVLDGVEYNTPLNSNGQTLHGGDLGIDRVMWEVAETTDSTILLTYIAPDMQDGFPGNLSIKMKYSLTSNDEFKVEYSATTDKKTIINLSHHSFFNLKGEAGGTILDNILTIDADNIIPTDVDLIPTGEILPVEGTPYDFRQATAIGDRIECDHEQLKFGKGYDICWCINRKDGDKSIKTIATLYEPTSGRTMDILTDQIGLQFYSGNFFDGSSTGKNGKPLNFRESIALETQNYPDAINHDNFPCSVLEPGQEYTHTCIYKFYTK